MLGPSASFSKKLASLRSREKKFAKNIDSDKQKANWLNPRGKDLDRKMLMPGKSSSNWGLIMIGNKGIIPRSSLYKAYIHFLLFPTTHA